MAGGGWGPAQASALAPPSPPPPLPGLRQGSGAEWERVCASLPCAQRLGVQDGVPSPTHLLIQSLQAARSRTTPPARPETQPRGRGRPHLQPPCCAPAQALEPSGRRRGCPASLLAVLRSRDPSFLLTQGAQGSAGSGPQGSVHGPTQASEGAVGGWREGAEEGTLTGTGRDSIQPELQGTRVMPREAVKNL